MPTNIKKLDYYGFPVYVRIERRANGNVVIFSFRQLAHGQLRIIYEHPPRRVPALEKLLQEAECTGIWEDDNGHTILELLPADVMQEFFCAFLDCSTPENRKTGLERRKSLVDITLGVLISADRARLISLVNQRTGKPRAASSIEDDINAIRCLCRHEGCTRWRDVTPAHCLSWLSQESEHMRKSCARVMKSLLLPLLHADIINDLLGWDDYDPSEDAPSKPSYSGLVQRNILPTMLTYRQCRTLLAQYFTSSGPKIVSGVDFALLLALTLNISAEELCALTINSFAYLKDYPSRLTVKITHEYRRSPSGTNYRHQEIEDQYQRRMLPLSHLAQQCYEAICARRKLTGDSPLVPSRNNSRRHMTPADLEKEFKARISALFSNYSSPIDGVKMVSFKEIIANTAERELRKGGCEEEELRYLQGKQPLIVSAVSYADFLNESEQNKLGALQDRWLNKVFPLGTAKEPTTTLCKKGATIDWITAYRDSRTNVSFSIDFPEKELEAVPEEGITLELYTLHGFSGTISWE